MDVCVCGRVFMWCMYVCMYVCVCLYVCTYVCVCVRVYVCTCACVRARAHTCVCMCVCCVLCVCAVSVLVLEEGRSFAKVMAQLEKGQSFGVRCNIFYGSVT